MAFSYITAGDLAKERLENYLKEKLASDDPLFVWHFCTYLLEQAKKHKTPDIDPVAQAYLADCRKASEITRKANEVPEIG